MFEEFSGRDFNNIPKANRDDSSEYSEEEIEELNTPIFTDEDDKEHYKIILQAGEGKERPGQLDHVEIEENDEKKKIVLTEIDEKFSQVLRTMKKNEVAEVHLRENIMKVKMLDWISVIDILGDGRMIKTIMKRGLGYDLIDFKDDVELELKIVQENSVLLENTCIVSCETPLIPVGLFELLRTMKLLECSSVLVLHDYFVEAFQGFVQVNPGHITLEIAIKDLKKVEDMYLDGSFYKKIVTEGQGKNLPNPNATVRIKYQLEISGKVVLTNFETDFLEIKMDEDQVPNLWTHCLRQMKEGDIVKVECNMMGLHANYLNDGLDHKFNYDTYAIENEHSCIFTISLVSFDMGKVNYNMTYEDRCVEANRIKDAGNKLFKVGRYERALEKYESANSSLEPITDSPSILRPIHLLLFGNITLCYLKLEKWHEAETHARKVLEHNPNDIKSLYRRAVARIALQNYEAANDDLKNAKMNCEEKNDKEMLTAVNHEINKVKALTKASKAKEQAIYKNLFQ